ncbi:hypothetical protein C8R45DRAFT_1109128 [Mycena sanguinolenta]|nr:hypothetical protein C8R45DRAFT_1109128 [Mycena sanguinolenta]
MSHTFSPLPRGCSSDSPKARCPSKRLSSTLSIIRALTHRPYLSRRQHVLDVCCSTIHAAVMHEGRCCWTETVSTGINWTTQTGATTPLWKMNIYAQPAHAA